jgi:hypothetical protein
MKKPKYRYFLELFITIVLILAFTRLCWLEYICRKEYGRGFDKGFRNGLFCAYKVSLSAVGRIAQSRDHYLQMRFIQEIGRMAKEGVKHEKR